MGRMVTRRVFIWPAVQSSVHIEKMGLSCFLKIDISENIPWPFMVPFFLTPIKYPIYNSVQYTKQVLLSVNLVLS